MSDYKDRKYEVLAYAKQSYEEALFAGTSGNLSTYDENTGIMIITPSSVPYSVMEIDDIMAITLGGTVISGRCRPSSEWRMHAEIYKSNKNIKAVVHTHSPYATSFAVSNEHIPVILIEMVYFLRGDIPVTQFALPGTAELGVNAVKKLENRSSCLLANHGTVSAGENLNQAHIRAVYTENAAKIYFLAKQNGNVQIIPEKYIKMMQKK